MKRSTAAFIAMSALFVSLLISAHCLERVGVANIYSTKIYSGGLSIAITAWEPVEERVGTIILIHGVLASKEMMYPLASDLARAGWRVILVDQMGHGGTEGQYILSTKDLEDSVRALGKIFNQTKGYRKAIINYLKDILAPNESIVFGGHSLGAFLAMVLAGEVQKDLNVLATIAIAPPYFPGIVNSSTPRNLLICLGKHDEFIGLDIAKMYLNPTNPVVIKPGRLYGSFSNGTARMIFVSELSDHLLEPYDPKIISKVLEWIDNARGVKGVRHVALGTLIAEFKALAGLIGIAIVALIPPIVSSKLGMISGGKRFPAIEYAKTTIVVSIVVWPLLTVVLLAGFLSGMVTIAGRTGYVVPVLVSGYLFVATIAILFSSSILSRSSVKSCIQKTLLSIKSDFGRGTILGIIEAFVFIVILQMTYGSILISMVPQTPGRFLVFIPTAFAVFWYFMFHEYFYRAQIQEIFGGRRHIAIILSILTSLASKVTVMLTITFLIYIVSPIKVIAIFSLIGMTMIALLTEGLAAASYYATREIYPHALASAIVWASIVTAAFPTAKLIVML